MDPLVPVKDLKAIVGKQFDVVYSKCYYKLMREKLGLVDSTELVKKVIDELIEVMHYCGTNYTNFFRILSEQNQEFSL